MMSEVPIREKAVIPPAEVDVAVAMTFDAFYRSTYRRTVRLATFLTGSRPAAEDVVQDVMADAHKRWQRISAYDEPSAWLRRAVLNRVASRRRRLAVAARGALGLASQARRDFDPAPADAELWRRVAALPLRQAQMVALVHVDDLAVSAAADHLGISVTTAKTHLQRAISRLETDLSDWRTP